MTSNEEVSLFDSMKAAAPELQDSHSGKARSTQEEEEKLTLNAWQSMQHSLCKDCSRLPQSFLAKQRQSTQARMVFSTRLQPRKEP